MITQENNLFSDIDFFNDLFKSIHFELNLKVFKDFLREKKLIHYFDESKLNIKSSPPEYLLGTSITSTQINQNVDIYFECRNKKNNAFNPIAINIDCIQNNKSYSFKVLSVTYAFNEKRITIGFKHNYSYAKWAFEKYIRFENEKKDEVLHFYIDKENFQFFDSKNSKQLCIDYLYPLSTLEEAFNSINRILLLKPASKEQQEVDLLKYDTNLENCSFSGQLNKAEFLLYDKNAILIKQKPF